MTVWLWLSCAKHTTRKHLTDSKGKEDIRTGASASGSGSYKCAVLPDKLGEGRQDRNELSKYFHGGLH